MQRFFFEVSKGSLYLLQPVSRKACGIFYPVDFVAPVLAFIFIKQVIVVFSCLLVKFPLVLKRLRFAALVAAQPIPLALCQKIFPADLALPETRWIVEKIFDLAVHGRGAASITRILVEEKIPTPGWLNYERYGTFVNIYAGAPTEKPMRGRLHRSRAF